MRPSDTTRCDSLGTAAMRRWATSSTAGPPIQVTSTEPLRVSRSRSMCACHDSAPASTVGRRPSATSAPSTAAPSLVDAGPRSTTSTCFSSRGISTSQSIPCCRTTQHRASVVRKPWFCAGARPNTNRSITLRPAGCARRGEQPLAAGLGKSLNRRDHRTRGRGPDLSALPHRTAMWRRCSPSWTPRAGSRPSTASA
jgi:hypothetical protein